MPGSGVSLRVNAGPTAGSVLQLAGSTKPPTTEGRGCVAGVGVGSTDPASSGTGRPLWGPPFPRLGGLAQRQHLLLSSNGGSRGELRHPVGAGEHHGDVIGDGHSGLVGPIAHDGCERLSQPSGDQGAVALVRTTSTGLAN